MVIGLSFLVDFFQIVWRHSIPINEDGPREQVKRQSLEEGSYWDEWKEIWLAGCYRPGHEKMAKVSDLMAVSISEDEPLSANTNNL